MDNSNWKQFLNYKFSNLLIRKTAQRLKSSFSPSFNGTSSEAAVPSDLGDVLSSESLKTILMSVNINPAAFNQKRKSIDLDEISSTKKVKKEPVIEHEDHKVMHRNSSEIFMSRLNMGELITEHHLCALLLSWDVSYLEQKTKPNLNFAIQRYDNSLNLYYTKFFSEHLHNMWKKLETAWDEPPLVYTAKIVKSRMNLNYVKMTCDVSLQKTSPCQEESNLNNWLVVIQSECLSLLGFVYKFCKKDSKYELSVLLQQHLSFTPVSLRNLKLRTLCCIGSELKQQAALYEMQRCRIVSAIVNTSPSEFKRLDCRASDDLRQCGLMFKNAISTDNIKITVLTAPAASPSYLTLLERITQVIPKGINPVLVFKDVVFLRQFGNLLKSHQERVLNSREEIAEYLRNVESVYTSNDSSTCTVKIERAIILSLTSHFNFRLSEDFPTDKLLWIFCDAHKCSEMDIIFPVLYDPSKIVLVGDPSIGGDPSISPSSLFHRLCVKVECSNFCS